MERQLIVAYNVARRNFEGEIWTRDYSSMRPVGSLVQVRVGRGTETEALGVANIPLACFVQIKSAVQLHGGSVPANDIHCYTMSERQQLAHNTWDRMWVSEQKQIPHQPLTAGILCAT